MCNFKSDGEGNALNCSQKYNILFTISLLLKSVKIDSVRNGNILSLASCKLYPLDNQYSTHLIEKDLL
jgi:hypothetical protein